MKMKHGLIWVMALCVGLTTVLADQPTLPPPPGSTPPPPATAPPTAAPAPIDNSATSTNKAAAKKAKKKPAPKKKETAPAPLTPPLPDNSPAVSKQNNVNVRAQAHINSEVITRLKQGEAVTVLGEVTLKHPKTDEPARWARIALPAGTHVWVNTAYIDATNQTVKPPKLNIRSGAGENYSVIGTLQKGDTVKPLETKGEWTQIEAPTNAFGFVAAHLLMSAPAPVEPVTPPPVPTETVVQNNVPIAPPPSSPPPANPTPVAPPPVITPVVPAALPPPPTNEPPPKRIVQREGIVGGTVSIQAPTHYELQSLDDGRIIDYLYTSSTNVVLKKYKGRTVLVSGEEELDERWPNTPVITIQKIQVVE